LRTSPETVETCVAFAKRLGKAPVVVADSTGYIVNRLLVPYMVDAIACLERGLGSIADIDAAMQNGANHPMGPLALADFIGLDIVFHMSSLLHEEHREPRVSPRPGPPRRPGGRRAHERARRGISRSMAPLPTSASAESGASSSVRSTSRRSRGSLPRLKMLRPASCARFPRLQKTAKCAR